MSSINGTWHLRTAVLTFAAIGLATACTGPPAAPPTNSAPSVDSTAASGPAPTTPAAPSAHPHGVEPVNCGEVGPDGGAQVNLIADSTPAGRVGCTEAINVITEYYRRAPSQAEGTGHHLVVDRWACAADTGAYGSGSIGCGKDGFAFHTEP
jgi:hypothetical protein